MQYILLLTRTHLCLWQHCYTPSHNLHIAPLPQYPHLVSVYSLTHVVLFAQSHARTHADTHTHSHTHTHTHTHTQAPGQNKQACVPSKPAGRLSGPNQPDHTAAAAPVLRIT